MKLARILALFFAFLATPAIADDAVALKERVKYYNVRGLTEEAIARSLHRDTPRQIGTFQSQTNVWLSWTFDRPAVGSRDGVAICSVANAKVNIDILIILPRHPHIARAPEAVQAVWRSVTAAMETHERNHARDAVEIGSKIPDALNAITAPCAAIQDIADDKGQDYVSEAQNAADRYDGATNHGETEGTAFPGL